MYLDTSYTCNSQGICCKKIILHPSDQPWPFCSQAQGSLSEILSSNDPEVQPTEVVP